MLSIISQLCLQLHDCKEKDCSVRLLSKFLENEYEKLDRFAELFVKYTAQLAFTDKQLETLDLAVMQARLQDGVDPDEEDEEEDLEKVEFRHSRRLEGGLFALQQAAVVLAFNGIYGGSQVVENISSKLAAESSENVLTMDNNVLSVIREAASYADGGIAGLLGVVPGSDGLEPGQEPDARVVASGFSGQRKLLIEWSAALSEKVKEFGVEANSNPNCLE